MSKFLTSRFYLTPEGRNQLAQAAVNEIQRRPHLADAIGVLAQPAEIAPKAFTKAVYTLAPTGLTLPDQGFEFTSSPEKWVLNKLKGQVGYSEPEAVTPEMFDDLLEAMSAIAEVRSAIVAGEDVQIDPLDEDEAEETDADEDEEYLN